MKVFVLIQIVKIHREKLLFIVSGGIQYLLDICLFALLVFATGNNMYINIASRCSAGVAGFYINGYVVFKSLKEQSLQQVVISGLRFLLLLGCMTVISSVLLGFFVNLSPLHFILAKGFIEIVLALLSFFIQKYVVYGVSAKKMQHL